MPIQTSDFLNLLKPTFPPKNMSKNIIFGFNKSSQKPMLESVNPHPT